MEFPAESVIGNALGHGVSCRQDVGVGIRDGNRVPSQAEDRKVVRRVPEGDGMYRADSGHFKSAGDA